LNNGGNCRKQKPQTVKRCFVRPSVRPSVRPCEHNVRLSVRPLVRPCGANIMFVCPFVCPSVRPSVRCQQIIYFSKESTYLWFIYSRRCGVVCPTELGLLHFLKGMVFQVSELSQKQLLTYSQTFSTKTLFVPKVMAIFRQLPPYRDVECRMIKYRDFRPICRFISEMTQHRAIVAM